MTLLQVLDLNQGSSRYERDEIGQTSPTCYKLVAVAGIEPVRDLMRVTCTITLPRNKLSKW